VDYVSPRENTCVFSTCPEERSRMIFQLGTASGPLASEAALLVHKDVRGIDVNMGCPKSFSVKGGMGAALLDRPEIVEDILKTLRRTLPASCSVTCKVRMKATTEKTREFLQVCERSGAEAITVHMRQRDERPAEPAHWDEIVKLWDAVKVPMIANGDFFSRRQIDEFWKHCHKTLGIDTDADIKSTKAGPAGIMIARGALWNPSIFCRGREPPSFEEVVRSYTRTAVAANATYQNTKWLLSQMLAGGIGVTVPTSYQGTPLKAFNRQISATKNMAGVCTALGDPYEAEKYPPKAHTTQFYRGVDFGLGVVAAEEEEAASKEALDDSQPERKKRLADEDESPPDGSDAKGVAASGDAKRSRVDEASTD